LLAKSWSCSVEVIEVGREKRIYLMPVESCVDPYDADARLAESDEKTTDLI